MWDRAQDTGSTGHTLRVQAIVEKSHEHGLSVRAGVFTARGKAHMIPVRAQGGESELVFDISVQRNCRE